MGLPIGLGKIATKEVLAVETNAVPSMEAENGLYGDIDIFGPPAITPYFPTGRINRPVASANVPR
jgi:hypothetical protein